MDGADCMDCAVCADCAGRLGWTAGEGGMGRVTGIGTGQEGGVVRAPESREEGAPIRPAELAPPAVEAASK